MSKPTIEQKLDDYAGAHVPDNLDLWPTLAARLASPPSPKRGENQARLHHQLRPPREQAQKRPVTYAGFATALLLLVGLLAFTFAQLPNGGAASQGTTERPLLDINMLDAMGFGHVARLGQQPYESRSDSGYTVTLMAAYADANHVAIVYSVAGPPGKHFTPTANTLKDDKGRILAPLFYRPDFSGPGIYLVVFDAGILAELEPPGKLNLRLSLQVAEISTAHEQPGIFNLGDVSQTWMLVYSQPAYWQLAPQTPLPPATGELRFDLTLPVDVDDLRVVMPSQVVTAGGTSITLEHVFATAGETRAILSFSPPLDKDTPLRPVVAMRPDVPASVAMDNLHLSTLRRIDDLRWSFSLFTSPAEMSQPWRLIVSALTGGEGVTPIAGPWEFTFTMPAALK